MAKQKLVALVTIELDDPAPDSTPRLREAIIAALPSLSRVLGVMPEHEAAVMLSAHSAAWEQAIAALGRSLSAKQSVH